MAYEYDNNFIASLVEDSFSILHKPGRSGGGRCAARVEAYAKFANWDADESRRRAPAFKTKCHRMLEAKRIDGFSDPDGPGVIDYRGNGVFVPEAGHTLDELPEVFHCIMREDPVEETPAASKRRPKAIPASKPKTREVPLASISREKSPHRRRRSASRALEDEKGSREDGVERSSGVIQSEDGLEEDERRGNCGVYMQDKSARETSPEIPPPKGKPRGRGPRRRPGETHSRLSVGLDLDTHDDSGSEVDDDEGTLVASPMASSSKDTLIGSSRGRYAQSTLIEGAGDDSLATDASFFGLNIFPIRSLAESFSESFRLGDGDASGESSNSSRVRSRGGGNSESQDDPTKGMRYAQRSFHENLIQGRVCQDEWMRNRSAVALRCADQTTSADDSSVTNSSLDFSRALDPTLRWDKYEGRFPGYYQRATFFNAVMRIGSANPEPGVLWCCLRVSDEADYYMHLLCWPGINFHFNTNEVKEIQFGATNDLRTMALIIKPRQEYAQRITEEKLKLDRESGELVDPRSEIPGARHVIVDLTELNNGLNLNLSHFSVDFTEKRRKFNQDFLLYFMGLPKITRVKTSDLLTCLADAKKANASMRKAKEAKALARKDHPP